MINFTSSVMGNVKFENARYVQNNVTTAEFASTLLIVSNVDIILFNLKTPE